MRDTVRSGPRGSELTHSQTQIWIGQRLHPESPLYNMAFAFVFEGELSSDLFARAFRRVADASDALRTTVVERDGAARRRTIEPGACMTEVLDPGWPDDAERRFLRWCRERCSRPLAVDRQLIDSVLVRLGGKTGWYLDQHHLIADAWSTVLLYRQVAAEYEALAAGTDAAPPLADYYPTASALRSRPGHRTAALEHWASRASTAGRRVALYGRSTEPADTASDRLTLELDADRSRALERLARQDPFRSLSEELSRFALFATLLVGWLYRVSGRAEIGFDAPVAGRPTRQAKRALGLFIELFPFAATVGPRDTFRSLGARCLAEAQALLRHALAGTSSPSPGGGNVVLNYFPQAFGEFAGLPAEVEWLHPGHGDRVHALRLQVHDFGGTGRITLHFDSNVRALPERLRRRAPRHFEKLLDALLDDPDARIAAVDLATGEERRAVRRLNRFAAAPPPERTVLARFEAQARAAPERVALRQGASAVTFGRLHEAVEALAATLAAAGVERGDRVAIASRRSIDAVVALLAVLRMRAAFVWIDPAYPRRRRAEILRDSGVRLLLAGAGQEADDDLEAGVWVLPLDAGPARSSDAAGARAPDDRPTLDDLAYVLYTSGSTGRPKGVGVCHDGLADYLGWAARRYVRGERLRYPLFTSLAFDLTLTSLFLPLVTGGELWIYPEPDGPVDSALFDVARDDAVDFLKLTPSHLSLLLQTARPPRRIRRLVVGGEDFKTRLAAAAARALGGVEIHNEYGPTEAVVGCVAHRYDPDADAGARVPIGRPAEGVGVEVLNAALAPVPAGVPGELWISRRGLARGYLGSPAATAERFMPRPGAPGMRRYRTGDRVRLVDEGAVGLEYLGRLDRQLKVSGLRVEPAEIEAALSSLPGVEQCAVVARRRPAAPPDGEVRHCVRCGLPSSHPRAALDRRGVCGVCRAYARVEEHARGYFRSMDDLRRLFEESAERRPAAGDGPRYDCMMLVSGGKDSTYALCRLVEMGLSVYAFTLDNGFIAKGAKDNVRRVAGKLGVPVELATTPAMPAIFRDSLERFANVCQGCFKTIYTLATNRARELGIPIIVTGLSRGQMFETRLSEEMFAGGRRSPEEIDAAVLAARKVYHRADDAVARTLDVEIFSDDRVFEEIRFVDFYRYCDVGLAEILATLEREVPWVRPEDTGRSTNCLINDLGIWVHKKEHGYHNYALPYSWDVRLGHKTRAVALAELDDEIDLAYVRETLAAIGADPERWTADPDRPLLAAFYVASSDPGEDRLREQLAERLPAPLVPAVFERLEALPLTAHGKLDEDALPAIGGRRPGAPYRPPEGPVGEFLAGVWREQLGVDRVGAEDSFFALGGTSLGAMEVMIRLCREFDLDLPLATLFAHPTLGELARVAEDRILADVAGLSDEDRDRLLAKD